MDYTIHDLPESERPREKLMEKGVEALSDAELLAVLLRTGIPGKNVKELSFEILEEFQLQDIPSADPEEFKELEGISDVKAGQLKAIGEIGLRLQREERDRLDSLSDVKARVEDLKFKASEVIRVFYLNSGNELLAEKEFDGSVSEAGVEPRDLFKEAMKCDAAALILAHNHPSGESSFTKKDLEFTRKLVELGEGLGVEVLDHVVVGRNVESMREASNIW